jgi:hypothetical protein
VQSADDVVVIVDEDHQVPLVERRARVRHPNTNEVTDRQVVNCRDLGS